MQVKHGTLSTAIIITEDSFAVWFWLLFICISPCGQKLYAFAEIAVLSSFACEYRDTTNEERDKPQSGRNNKRKKVTNIIPISYQAVCIKSEIFMNI